MIVATDLFPHEQMHRPEVAVALGSSLRLQGRGLIAAYEAGGCAAAQPLMAGTEDRIYLASREGTVYCDTPPVSDLRGLATRAARSSVPVASNFRSFELVALPVTGASGKPYLLLLKSNYTMPYNLFGLAVGRTTIWISTGVLLLLGILVAMPIRRVRTAAREIANGRLGARVRLGWLYERFPRLLGADVLSCLAVDFNHMADRLELLADAQRTLFRDISHELRSPLARLNVALELAREAGPASMRSPLYRIENEAARVNDLVGQLLTLSHM